MKTVTQKENEPRSKYLVRVSIEMLRENAGLINNIIFDEAECDAHCLADDLEIELDCGNFDEKET
jgi:hypothetical protein